MGFSYRHVQAFVNYVMTTGNIEREEFMNSYNELIAENPGLGYISVNINRRGINKSCLK